MSKALTTSKLVEFPKAWLPRMRAAAKQSGYTKMAPAIRQAMRDFMFRWTGRMP